MTHACNIFPRWCKQVAIADEYIGIDPEPEEPVAAVDAPVSNDVGGGCPDYVPSETLAKDFLPAPENRLVPELSSAELHELRKDSKALHERFEYISRVLEVKP